MTLARWPARLLVGTLCMLLGGCTQLRYYTQAAQGQYALWSGARPIGDWLDDPATEPRLKVRLAKAQQIRRFAVSELDLPDNGSYKNYASLRRPFVLWNVVATPELSLQPLQWCFPIAGCVNYRGYYSKEEALAYADELRAQHYDVQVGGVPAYSTLGWFDDPLLSTFINYNDAELARLIFHELAHQVVYVPGDSAFNESFASAVEEAGVQRWLAREGNDAMRAAYAQYAARRQDFLALLLTYRGELDAVYASGASDADKRARKAQVFAALQDAYQVLKQNWGGFAGYDRWFEQPLSNAHLASVSTYNEFLPAFKKLLEEKKNFRAFYAAVHTMAQIKKPERRRALEQLSSP
ncbi:aminopeptidase [Janthinobacterium sp. BJB426]|uniref:aminopeptidase n=1 Tax=Janthinobacterium sp. BJB426 TaxID=2048010 RepID=UPI000C0DAED1|nr:aminopeptidase [Janthinobacterium sp. BJB426]PHV29575.1 aminopeptidase [Janthinobacterium sp. BJB426]